MTTKDLYSNKEDCCGCELCANVCPQKIITMQEDEVGFLYPTISNESNCVNCKRCVNVCPSKAPGRLSLKILNSYGGHVNNLQNIKSSSSGGIASEIGRLFIRTYDSAVVYGVKYADNFMSITYGRTTTEEGLYAFKTSKYAQARKEDVYNRIAEDLSRGLKVLFIGLPCEVSAVYHRLSTKYIENLFSISLICHGPTSLSVHKEYCTQLKFRKTVPLTKFSVRFKKTGWKPYFIYCETAAGEICTEKFAMSKYDIAFKYLKRPSCRICKYKLNREDFGIMSDLVLGDFHAVQTGDYCYNSWGVSEILSFTEKGEDLLNLIKDSSVLEKLSENRIMSGNIALLRSIIPPKGERLFIRLFKVGGLKKACENPIIRIPIISKYLVKQTKVFLHKLFM